MICANKIETAGDGTVIMFVMVDGIECRRRAYFEAVTGRWKPNVRSNEMLMECMAAPCMIITVKEVDTRPQIPQLGWF